MRRLVSCLRTIALTTLAVGPTAAHGQDRVPPDARPVRPRIVAELSDLLTHTPLEACAATVLPAVARKPARIVTWNIRGARSAPVAALAAELRAMQADIVALQEVDVRTRRGGFEEQPAALAAALGFHYVFAASIKWDEGDYGLALLSRWPMTEVRRHRLDTTLGAEPRIVLEATVCADGRPLHLFNHHADGRVATRHATLAQVQAVLQPHIGSGIIVAGDFNEPSNAPGVRALLDAGLVDLGGGGVDVTTGSGRIDHLLADALLASRLSPARVWRTVKSDHHAVFVELDW